MLLVKCSVGSVLAVVGALGELGLFVGPHWLFVRISADLGLESCRLGLEISCASCAMLRVIAFLAPGFVYLPDRGCSGTQSLSCASNGCRRRVIVLRAARIQWLAVWCHVRGCWCFRRWCGFECRPCWLTWHAGSRWAASPSSLTLPVSIGPLSPGFGVGMFSVFWHNRPRVHAALSPPSFSFWLGRDVSVVILAAGFACRWSWCFWYWANWGWVVGGGSLPELPSRC